MSIHDRTQLTLGELIAALKQRDPSEDVYLAFGYFHPSRLCSWRGDYSQLAIGYTTEGEAPKVAEFIKTLEAAIGAEFHGWKGGEYTMYAETPVWVAAPNEGCHAAVIGIAECSYRTVIETAWLE